MHLELTNRTLMFGGNGKNTFKDLNKDLRKTLKPIIEAWSLTNVSDDIIVYGIRRYLKGAWLSLHLDRQDTHVLSAILQVECVSVSCDIHKTNMSVLSD